MATDASVRSAQETSNDFCVICTCLGTLLTTDKLHFCIFFGYLWPKNVWRLGAIVGYHLQTTERFCDLNCAGPKIYCILASS